MKVPKCLRIAQNFDILRNDSKKVLNKKRKYAIVNLNKIIRFLIKRLFHETEFKNNNNITFKKYCCWKFIEIIESYN